jgi:citrate lyase synthetase
MKITRRDAVGIGLGGIAGGVLGCVAVARGAQDGDGLAAPAQPATIERSSGKRVVISTWSHGVAAN